MEVPVPQYQFEKYRGKVIVIQQEPVTDGTEVLKGIRWIVVKLDRFDIVSMFGMN